MLSNWEVMAALGDHHPRGTNSPNSKCSKTICVTPNLHTVDLALATFILIYKQTWLQSHNQGLNSSSGETLQVSKNKISQAISSLAMKCRILALGVWSITSARVAPAHSITPIFISIIYFHTSYLIQSIMNIFIYFGPWILYITLQNKLDTSFSEENHEVKTHRANSKNKLPLKHKVAPVKIVRDSSGLYDPPPHLLNKVSWPRPHTNAVTKQGLELGPLHSQSN